VTDPTAEELESALEEYDEFAYPAPDATDIVLAAARRDLARLRAPAAGAPSEAVAELGCFDCGRKYSLGPDLVVPNEDFARIAPNPPDGGVLCPNCMHDRFVKLLGWPSYTAGGIRAVFTSGPFAETEEQRAEREQALDALERELAEKTARVAELEGELNVNMVELIKAARIIRKLESQLAARPALEKTHYVRSREAQGYAYPDCLVCKGEGTVSSRAPEYCGWRWCDCAVTARDAMREPAPKPPEGT
jgi:hypothetical protein